MASLIKYYLLQCNIYRIIYITRQMDYSETLTGTYYLESLKRHVWWLLWLKWQMLLFISRKNLRLRLSSHWNVFLTEMLNKLSIWLWNLILWVCFFSSIFILKTKWTRWTNVFHELLYVFDVKNPNITSTHVCMIPSIGIYDSYGRQR